MPTTCDPEQRIRSWQSSETSAVSAAYLSRHNIAPSVSYMPARLNYDTIMIRYFNMLSCSGWRSFRNIASCLKSTVLSSGIIVDALSGRPVYETWELSPISLETQPGICQNCSVYFLASIAQRLGKHRQVWFALDSSYYQAGSEVLHLWNNP